MMRQEHGSTVAVYPGSFDPVTHGHLDIIHRAAKVFDKLIVAVLNNTSKNPLFTLEERMELIRKVTKDLPNVEVDGFRDLMVNYMKARNVRLIVRGLRAVSDFEYELQMASTNHKLNPDVETFFMTSKPQFSYLSSSIVKEIAKFHGPVEDLVPAEVEEALQKEIPSNLMELRNQSAFFLKALRNVEIIIIKVNNRRNCVSIGPHRPHADSPFIGNGSRRIFAFGFV